MKLTKEQLLALSKCNTEFVSTMKLSEKVANCERIGTGNFSMCYKSGNIAIKKYFGNPYLQSSDTGDIIFSFFDVVNNLIELSNLNNGFPKKIYIDNDELIAYEMPFARGYLLGMFSYLSSNKDTQDISLNTLNSIWNKAYDYAKYYASKGFVMYDFHENNCAISGDKLTIFDVDFFHKEPLNKNVLSDNYRIVNTCFENFLEMYFFEKCYEVSSPGICSVSFKDDVIADLISRSSGDCKSLLEILNKIK